MTRTDGESAVILFDKAIAKTDNTSHDDIDYDDGGYFGFSRCSQQKE